MGAVRASARKVQASFSADREQRTGTPQPTHSLPAQRRHLVPRGWGADPRPRAGRPGVRGRGLAQGPTWPSRTFTGPGRAAAHRVSGGPPSPPAEAELEAPASPRSPPARGSAAPPSPPPPRGVTRPPANRGSRGGKCGRGPGRSRAAPLSHGLGALLPKTSALIVLGMFEVEKGSEAAGERLEDRGPLGEGRTGVARAAPPPSPKPITFPNLSSILFPASPGSRGWRARGEGTPSRAARGREAGPRAGGGPAWGWLFPTRLFFFFFTRVGMGCFLVALKRRNTHETGRPPPTPESRHGTPSPRGPARCAPELGSSPRARARVPTPRPGRLHSGEGMLIRVGPARDGGGGERRQRAGGAGRGAGRAVAKRRPPAAGPRSPGRSRRGLTQCRAARRAEPAPRPAYWASARRDRGLQQITN